MKLILVLSLLTNFAWAQIIPSTVDLYDRADDDTYGKTPDKIHKDNLANLKKFFALNVDTNLDNSYFRAQYLNPKYAKEVYDTASNNPVVSLYQYSKYDPKNEGIGFCFGRAMFVHLELVQHGFDRDSIKKAFVVGSMQTPDGGSWGWHVTTIVQSKKNGKEEWLTIDPITDRIMTVKEWYEEMRKEYSTDKKLKLYITSSGRLGVNNSVYEEGLMTASFYNNYFSDMRAWFDKESRTTNRYKVPYKEYK